MTNNVKYKVLIIETSNIVASGLSSIINESKDFYVTTSISDISVFPKHKITSYDIIIINPNIVNITNRSDVKTALQIPKDIPVIAISYDSYDDSIMLQFNGCINIYDKPSAISKKLNAAFKKTKAKKANDNNELTSRERSILTSVALGKTNKEIADEYNLSIYTVVTHRKNISHKLGINSISGLTVYAILNKLIDVEDF